MLTPTIFSQDNKGTAAGNSTLAIGGVFPMKNRDRLYSADSFVVAESSVLRTNPDSYRDAVKPALRVAANRYSKFKT
jgi:hypothetical protein